jgi:hypothetical protein
VVQPAEEEYDREAVIQVTSEGYVTRSEVGIGGDARAFETAKLGFANPEAHTFKVDLTQYSWLHVRLTCDRS